MLEAGIMEVHLPGVGTEEAETTIIRVTTTGIIVAPTDGGHIGLIGPRVPILLIFLTITPQFMLMGPPIIIATVITSALIPTAAM
jgi:hypothetical protein